MARAFLQCESHPGRKLTDHLEDVGERLGVGLLRPVAMCHDVGKATDYFQDYISGTRVDPSLKQHALLGAEILLECLLGTGQGFRSDELSLAYLFVRRHHGRLEDLVDAVGSIDPRRRDLLARQRASLDVEGLGVWLAGHGYRGRNIGDQDRARIRVETGRALRAETDHGRCVARYLGSLRSFGRFIEADRDSAGGATEDAYRRAPFLSFGAVESFRGEHFGSGTSVRMGEARAALFGEAAAAGWKGTPRGRLWSLTAPTGSGKTLAAIGWALAMREAGLKSGEGGCPIIYALPFTSIIDQTVSVIKGFGGENVDESVLAVHHHLAEPGPIFEKGEWSLAQNWVEGWRAELVCTTFVQVVNALFHGTCSDARRLSHLVGGILILDEIQAVPAELWPVVGLALRSLSAEFGTDVLLMTATQPAILDSAEVTELAPAGYEGRFADVFDRYDLRVETERTKTPKELSEDVRGALAGDAGGGCLLVLNTIDEALNVYRLISGAAWSGDFQVAHLSTNLRPKDRRVILDRVRARAGRQVVISTQVVEAGVDLSFDIVFRALAPFDSIVQAAGRANRHGDGRRGIVRIVEMEGNTAAKVYGNVHVDVARLVCRRLGAARVSEREVRRHVGEYFLELKSRISRDRAERILGAVRMMEFASLRGEGEDKEKKVTLIEDEAERVPHYVAMDRGDEVVWEEFQSCLGGRSGRVPRGVRNRVGLRIVEVPRRFAMGAEADERTGVVFVARGNAGRYYDAVTGWRRGR